MSYDLYFQKPKSEEFPYQEFISYFKSRSRYKVENGQAFYENEDTGVYFLMEHNEEDFPK